MSIAASELATPGATAGTRDQVAPSPCSMSRLSLSGSSTLPAYPTAQRLSAEAPPTATSRSYACLVSGLVTVCHVAPSQCWVQVRGNPCWSIRLPTDHAPELPNQTTPCQVPAGPLRLGIGTST